MCPRVNFHGGGHVMPGTELNDGPCRYLAAEAGAVVVNVDYAVATTAAMNRRRCAALVRTVRCDDTRALGGPHCRPNVRRRLPGTGGGRVRVRDGLEPPSR
ncbi:alpha/beta hydrolase fold domain-containing protein [Nocardiopsis sp. NPDC050513]|uniref:alpha/beta hydrolase fold domain-containing protein n=1 Tax=Nocardiopsis sp. NPDC050513 TaxID=3364338 RepID=UPI0037A17A3D